MSLSTKQITTLRKIANGQTVNMSAAKLTRLFTEAGAIIDDDDNTPAGTGLKFRGKNAFVHDLRRRGRQTQCGNAIQPRIITSAIREMARALLNDCEQQNGPGGVQ